MKKRIEIITKFFLSVLTCPVIVSIFFALYGLFQISVLDKGYASYFGYGLFEVESGSMSPTIDVKDMVIVKETNKIKKDDIITYELEGNFITHRVVEVEKKKVVTKGDYNNFEDKTIPKKSVIGKVVLIIPKFGVWKEIILSPIVLIAIFFTLLLFGLGFSYEDRKLAAKKRIGFTFKNDFIEGSTNESIKGIKAFINKLFKKNATNNKQVVEEKEEKNTQNRELISINGKCKWLDDNDRDGQRPKTLIVKLINKDKVIDSKEISENDNWKYSFTNLYKYESEHEKENSFEIEYKIDSNMVSGYKKEIVKYDVINTHNPKKINITGEISWLDDNNKNNARPKSVVVKLVKNNEIINTKTISKDNKWKYTFIDLYKYENKEEIKYVIDED